MGYEAGSLIETMEENILGKELHEKINEVRKDKNWDEFWLIFQQKPDRFLYNVIRNGWTATNVKPHPISNTIQFYVNWKQGRVETEVSLPSREQSNMYNFDLYDGKGEVCNNRIISNPELLNVRENGLIEK